MEPSTYNAFADMLAKFHTSPAIIQALWLVAVPATLVGVTWCLTGVLREAIRALFGRRGFALDLQALEAAAVPRLGFGDGAGEPLRLAGPGAAEGVAAEGVAARGGPPQTPRDTFAADPSSPEDGGQAARDRVP